jgi:hypothetical protein
VVERFGPSLAGEIGELRGGVDGLPPFLVAEHADPLSPGVLDVPGDVLQPLATASLG